MNEPVDHLIERQSGLGLRAKLILFVVLGILLASGAVGLARVWQERERTTGLIKESGQERTLMLSLAVANLIIAYDYGNLESMADKLAAEPDILRVTIRNAEGKLLVERIPRSEPGLSFTAPVYFGQEKVGAVELGVSLRRLNEALAKTYANIMLEQLVFGLVLGLMVYVTMSRTVVRPLRHVTKVMGEIISNPHQQRIDPEVLNVSSNDEIGHLVSVFQTMNRTIGDYHELLNQKIDLANTALMHTNEQLLQRSGELEQRTHDLEKALESLEKLATTDSLTGLGNRRSMDELFHRLFVQARREGVPLTLILFDVDRFKQINDRYGHGAGDRVLMDLGGIFGGRMRRSDFAARLGGDEFAMLLYSCDEANAEKIVVKLTEKIAAHEFISEEATITVTLSVGIAQCNSAMSSAEALARAADKALYAAKEMGRDRWVKYSEIASGGGEED